MKNLGRVGIALVGLLAITESVTLLYLPATYFLNGPVHSKRELVLLATPFAIAVLLGMAIIVWRDSLASRWFDDSEVEIGVTPPALLRLGLILIGVDVSITAVGGVLTTLANGISQTLQSRIYNGPGEGASVATLVWTFTPGVLVRLIPLALGVLLVTYSSQLADRLWPAPPDA